MKFLEEKSNKDNNENIISRLLPRKKSLKIVVSEEKYKTICRTLLWITAMIFCVPDNLLLAQKEFWFSFCPFASALPPSIPQDNTIP